MRWKPRAPARSIFWKSRSAATGCCSSLKNALEQATLRRENERLRELVGGSPKMIGSSPAFARAVEQATMAARSDARVLLIGESGTGKELLAATSISKVRSPRVRS